MKALLFVILGVLTGVPAQAVVRPPGTFIAKECGAPRYKGSIPLVGIDEVCVGRMVVARDGGTKPSVQFRLTTGTTEVFLISQTKNLGVAPREPQFNRMLLELRSKDGKKRAVLRMLQTVEGRTHYLSGQLGVVKFEAYDFEPVFSVAGITDRR